jgi:hypothetical protein
MLVISGTYSFSLIIPPSPANGRDSGGFRLYREVSKVLEKDITMTKVLNYSLEIS